MSISSLDHFPPWDSGARRGAGFLSCRFTKGVFGEYGCNRREYNTSISLLPGRNVEDFRGVEVLVPTVDFRNVGKVCSGDFWGILIFITSISLSVLVSSTDSIIGFLFIPLACNLEHFRDLEELSWVVVFGYADGVGTGDFCGVSVDSSSVSLLLSPTKSTPSFLFLLLLLGSNVREFVEVDEQFLTVDLHEGRPVRTIGFRGV